MTNHHRVFCLVASLFVACCSNELWGQTPSAAKLYEQGVNAYFAGQSSRADELLSEAIQWNPQDPRAYYFRALSLMRQGRVEEARGDMQVGASFESQTPRRFAVGAALERVQGGNRLVLEQFRRNARRDAVVQASATVTFAPQPALAPTTFKAPEVDANVLRERRVVPLDELLRPGEPQAVPEPEAAAMPAVPQAPVRPGTPPQPAKASSTPGTPAAGNPFADDAAAPPDSPPAATPSTPPQPVPAQPVPADQPAESPPAESEENPFGG